MSEYQYARDSADRAAEAFHEKFSELTPEHFDNREGDPWSDLSPAYRALLRNTFLELEADGKVGIYV